MTKKKTAVELFEEALVKYGKPFGIDERYAKILTLLAESPRTFKELMVETDIPQPTLARRISWLIDNGYTKKYDLMRKSFYAPRVMYAIDTFGFSNLLRKILNEMETEYVNLRSYISIYRSLLKKFDEENFE